LAEEKVKVRGKKSIVSSFANKVITAQGFEFRNNLGAGGSFDGMGGLDKKLGVIGPVPILGKDYGYFHLSGIGYEASDLRNRWARFLNEELSFGAGEVYLHINHNQGGRTGVERNVRGNFIFRNRNFHFELLLLLATEVTENTEY
jgi:hypothetical protein